MRVADWNRLPAAEAQESLLSCCGSPAWTHALLGRRPYASLAALLIDAEAAWFALPESEWLVAFACHPRIGERKAEAETTVQFAAWSGTEQSSAQATLEAVARALAEANKLYEERFGFLYIVFASGRTAPQLLSLLEERLAHDRATELNEAARQQWEITRLRMTRYFSA
jgi:OHCU decarboxylase